MCSEKVLAFLSFILVSVFLVESSACKCPRMSPLEKAEEAEVILVGRPLKISGAHSMLFGSFKVEKTWKGEVSANDLFSQPMSSECGIRIIENGPKYLIYARTGGAGWRINTCTSLPIDKAQRELSFLSSRYEKRK